MRCYNGCPDSELQRYLNNLESLERKMKHLNPDASCIYFPGGEFYQIFVKYRPIGQEFKDRATALYWAINEFSK